MVAAACARLDVDSNKRMSQTRLGYARSVGGGNGCWHWYASVAPHEPDDTISKQLRVLGRFSVWLVACSGSQDCGTGAAAVGRGPDENAISKAPSAPSVAAQICQLPVSTRSVTQVSRDTQRRQTREAFAQGARFTLQAIRLAY